jgi:serine/threonine protein kinase
MKHCPVCLTDYGDQQSVCPTDGAQLLQPYGWAPGTIIRGRYRILSAIGQGGMGIVYKAQHIALEEVRALKVMSPQLASDPKFLRRFHQEAKVARGLKHPNLVHVDDLEQAEDGSLFIAMEYVEGVSLRELLRTSPGGLPAPRTLRIIRSIAGGLEYAHAGGLVHRDIKPENILIARNARGQDEPKILDFGIVALKESTGTVSSRPLLTTAYAAPEQWRGVPGNQLDGRTDLYALGVMFFEMLTGAPPFEASTIEQWMFAHLTQPPPAPSSRLPELAAIAGLDDLVLRLMAKTPEERPADAGVLLREISTIEAQISGSAGASPTGYGSTPAPGYRSGPSAGTRGPDTWATSRATGLQPPHTGTSASATVITGSRGGSTHFNPSAAAPIPAPQSYAGASRSPGQPTAGFAISGTASLPQRKSSAVAIGALSAGLLFAVIAALYFALRPQQNVSSTLPATQARSTSTGNSSTEPTAHGAIPGSTGATAERADSSPTGAPSMLRRTAAGSAPASSGNSTAPVRQSTGPTTPATGRMPATPGAAAANTAPRGPAPPLLSSLVGTITDGNGVALSGASVRLENQKDPSQQRNGTTDANGSFGFYSVPTGLYQLEIHYRQATYIRQHIVVEGGRRLTRQIVILGNYALTEDNGK